MSWLALLFRWQVLKALGALLQEVGKALEDGTFSEQEQARVWRAFLNIVNAYKRLPDQYEGRGR